MRAWILGEFHSPAALVAAVARLRDAGHAGLDTYTPYPVHGTSEAMRLTRSPVPAFALIGGLAGAVTAYLCQYLMVAWDYPLNVGGRPAHAAPSFIPITFELAILFSAFAIFFGLLFVLRLPQPYHPVFELPQFSTAATHAFWVSVETGEVERDEPKVSEALRASGATHVAVVREPSP